MKLAFSNIGFENADEERVYELLQEYKFEGLEIAPSKFIGENPYSKPHAAAKKARELKHNFGLQIPSMQSIWYGQRGNIFSDADAKKLEEYTAKAVKFASAVGCKSLVFGCPRNRYIPVGGKADDALTFFANTAIMCAQNGVRLALEANPAVYGTNFVNTSAQAFEFAKKVPNLYVNYDLGACITNGETLDILAENLPLVSHIHISEPQLAAVKKRGEHKQIADILKRGGYDNFVSIEMKTSAFDEVKTAVECIAEAFA
ncbi:MAG: sugar phosphate isomerase/epimerase [Clostridia bacterium]|nr:sugar phosphate isomerase/epimerase [Clostridia bacterium]NLS85786.1 TIM barrel protein [Oscillospiraceae bacterium]